MSNVIDERVVEMRFDDEDFERGVKSTIKYLEELRTKLNFDDAVKEANKSFKSINNITDNLDISKIEKAVDQINYRFSTIGVVATTAIQNAVNSVMDLGKNFISGTIGTVISKGWSRATNIDQASFTLKGLGLDVAQAMEDADFAVTDTAYGLDEAAKAASQLAASGISLGDDMKEALLAISGTAAMTNSDFSSMADIFTTVAGNGRLMTMQLNQMSGRGLNAAAALAQYYGTTEAAIREAVTHGEVSFEMFYKAMSDMYGEHAKEANSTYEGAYANLQSALGRISQPWWTQFRESAVGIFNTLTPKIKEFKTVFTDGVGGFAFVNSIKWISKGIEGIIDKIQVSKDVLKAIRISIYQPFKWVLLTFREIGRVAGEVFDLPTFKEVEAAFKRVHGWFRNIYDTYGITIGKIIRGEDFDIPLLNKIKDIFRGIFSIINIGAHAVKTIVKLATPFLKLIPKALDKLLGGAGKFGPVLEKLSKVLTGDNKFNEFVDKWSKTDLTDKFKNLGDNAKSFFDRLNTGNTDFSKFKLAMADLSNNGIVATFTSLKNEIGGAGIVGSFFLSILEKIVNIGSGIKQVFQDMKNGLNFKDALKNTSFGSKLADNMAIFKETFKGVDILSAPMESLKSRFSELISRIGLGGTIFAQLVIILQKVGNGLKSFGDKVKAAFSNLKESTLIKRLAEGFGKLRESITGFHYEGSGLQKFFQFLKNISKAGFIVALSVIQKIVEGIKAIATFIGAAFGYIAEVIKNTSLGNLLKGLTKSSDEAIAKTMAVPDKLEKFKDGMKNGLGGISDFFKTTFAGWDINDWIHVIETGVLTVLNGSLVGVFKNLAGTFSKISGLIGTIKKTIGSFQNIGNMLKKSLLSFSGADKKKSKFQALADGIKTIAQSILIIVAAIAILALIPEKNLNKGLSAMLMIAVVIGALITTLGAVSKKMSGSDKHIMALSSSVVKLCAGMMLIGISTAMLAKSDTGSILAAGLVMSTIMGTILGIFWAFNKIMNGVKGHGGSKASTKEQQQELLLEQFAQFVFIIKEVAKAVTMMNIAAAILATQDPGSILSATVLMNVMLWSIMGLFAVFTKFMNTIKGTGGKKSLTKGQKQDQVMEQFATMVEIMKQVGKAMIAMSVALTIVAATSKIAGTGRVWASFAMLELFMASVIGLAILVGKQNVNFKNFDKFGVGMIAVSAAMILMSAAIAVIGHLKPETALQGLGAIMLLMITVGAMAELAENNDNLLQLSVTILAMAGAAIMLAGAMKMMNQVKAGTILAAVVVIGIFTAGLAILITMTKNIDQNKLLTLSVAIISLASAMLAMAGAMTMMDGLEHTWRSFGQIALMLAAVVASMIVLGKFVNGTDLAMISVTLLSLSVALVAFAASMAMIGNMDTGSSWRAWGQIALALAALVAAALVLTYTGAFIGLIALGAAVEALGKGLALGALGIAAFIAAFSAAMVIFGGSADAFAAEIVAFAEVLAAGLGTVGVTLSSSIALIAKNVWWNIVSMAPDIADGLMVMIDAVLTALDEYGPDLVEKFLSFVTGVAFAIARSVRSESGIATAFDDLGMSLMAAITRSISRVLSTSDSFLARQLAQVLDLENVADQYKEAADKFSEAEDAYKEEHDAKYANKSSSAEGSGILDGLGIDGLSLTSITGGLTSGDIESTVASVLGGVDIQNMGGDEFQEKMTKALGGDSEIFSSLGEGGASEWFESFKSEMGDNASASDLSSQLIGDMGLSDAAEEDGEKTAEAYDKSFSKISDKFIKFTETTGDAEDKASKLMKAMREEFGDSSDEMQRLTEAGGWDYLKTMIEETGGDSTKAAENLSDLNSVLSTMTDTQKELAESENDDMYDKFYERGQAVIQGFADGMSDKSAAYADLIANSEIIARDTAAGVTDTLNMGNWKQPVPSHVMFEIGRNLLLGMLNGLRDESFFNQIKRMGTAVGTSVITALSEGSGVFGSSPSTKTSATGRYILQGLLQGLRDTSLRAQIKTEASSIANDTTNTIDKEAEVNSPSKRTMRTGIYIGQGLIIGMLSTKKSVNSATKKMVAGITDEFKSSGTLTKKVKKSIKGFAADIKSIEKHIRNAKTDKALKKWTNKLTKELDKLDKCRAKILGVKGKYKNAKMWLWESSDDYAELQNNLKDYQKEKTKNDKKNKKLAKENSKISKKDVSSLKNMQKRYKELNKLAKNTNDKKKKKELEKQAKALKKQIDATKEINKNIKETNKEIKKGYAKYWKEYWADLKSNIYDTFRQTFRSEINKTFELLSVSANVPNIFDATANSIDVISSSATEAANKIEILREAIEKVTDAMGTSYDTGIDLFSEFKTEWYNPSEFKSDMDDNIAGYASWLEGLKTLRNRNVEGIDVILDYIEDLGFSADTLSQLNMFNNMSIKQLNGVISDFTKKSEYERKLYAENMVKTVNDYEKWQSDLDILNAALLKKGLTSDLAKSIVDDLKEMGVDGADYVKKWLEMVNDTDTTDFSNAVGAMKKQAELSANAYFNTLKDEFENKKNWEADLETLKKRLGNRDIADEFYKAAKDMGTDGADYIAALVSMEDSKFNTILDYYESSIKEDSKSYFAEARDQLDDFANYQSDLKKIMSSNLGSDLKRYLESLGYDGYDVMKNYLAILDDPAMVKEANSIYAEQAKANADSYMNAIYKETEQYSIWNKNLDFLENAGVDRGLIKELMEGGVETAEKVAYLVTEVQNGRLKEINNLYATQQSLNANSLLNTTRSSMNDWYEYYNGVSKIMDSTYTQGVKLDESIISKIKEMGVDGLDYIREILSMTKDEIKELNSYADAERSLNKTNLKIDATSQAKKYSEWSSGLLKMAKKFDPSLITDLIEDGFSETSLELINTYLDMEDSEIAEINALYNNGAKALDEVMTDLKKAMEKSASNNKIQYANTLTSDKNLFKEAAKTMVKYVTDGIVESNPLIEEVAKSQATAYATALSNATSNQSSSIPAGTLTKINDTVDALVKQQPLATSVSTLASTMKLLQTRFGEYGANAIAAYINAMKNKTSLSNLRTACANIGVISDKSVRAALGINSPSRVFRQIGEYTLLGLTSGIEDNTYKATSAMADVASSIISVIQAMSEDASDLTDGVSMNMDITPIFDPDAATTGLAAIDEMIQSRQALFNTIGLNNTDDIARNISLQQSVDNLTAAINSMGNYQETIDNMNMLLETYLPDAAQDIYLDGAKVSNYVENTISNNIVRRRAGW